MLNAHPAEFYAYLSSAFALFSAQTMAEVISTLRSSPCKQCQSDPLPMWLLKESTEMLVPFLTTLLSSGDFQLSWKRDFVYLHLKRLGLKQAEVTNYHPVSNLPFLSKLLERVVNNQLVAYLTLNGLMPKDPLAYRKGYSTEMAVLCIHSDIFDEISNGKIALLCLLDLSATFDTIDHNILVHRLELSCELKGLALTCLQDYLIDRSQSVCCNRLTSASHQVLSRVSQGSVLDPIVANTIRLICGRYWSNYQIAWASLACLC